MLVCQVTHKALRPSTVVVIEGAFCNRAKRLAIAICNVLAMLCNLIGQIII